MALKRLEPLTLSRDAMVAGVTDTVIGTAGLYVDRSVLRRLRRWTREKESR